ncbi:MAG TPA: DUF5131 family protein [Caulobacteraceae bacterium]
MGIETEISWADATLNAWTGCTKVSPACDGCYAEHMMVNRYHRVVWGPHGERDQMKHWRSQVRKIEKRAIAHFAQTGNPLFVFCMSLGDVFDNQVPPEWRAELFAEIRKAQHCVYLLLTKRPQNIERMSIEAGGLPANAAIGCTVVSQPEADRDVPILLNAKQRLRALFAFVSMEPLLGPVDLTRLSLKAPYSLNALTGKTTMDPVGAFSPDVDVVHVELKQRPALDWVIVGGETDQGAHKARPSHPQWFRDLRDQCAAAGVVFHMKQNGEWVSVSEVEGPGEHFEFEDGATVRRTGKERAGRTLDHVVHDARPEVKLPIPA